MPPRPYTLLTGATGLIGGHLVLEFMARQFPLAILVRDTRHRTAQQKVEQMMLQLESATGFSLARPRVVIGDLSQADLGMSASDRAWVARSCERVLHNAAYLSFKPASEHPDGEPFRTNVDGLTELVELCRFSGIQEFHHVSSAYVCGDRRGHILETDLNCGQGFSNDYEHSKLLGEELLRTYFEHLTVYRPSIVIDPSLKRLNIGDRTIYQVFSMYEYLARMVDRPLPGELLSLIGVTGHERKNLVTADWVARMIVNVFADPVYHGRTYHLTHASGTTLNQMDVAFCQALEARGIDRKRSRLASEDVTSYGEVIRQFITTFAPYFRDDPVFDQANVLDVLAGDRQRLAPDVTDKMLCQLVGQPDTPLKQRPSPPAALATQDDQAASWTKALDERIASETAPAAEETRIGLLLYGPEGGDWVLCADRRGDLCLETGGAEAEEQVLCVRADDWGALLEGRLQLEFLIQKGRAVVQFQPGITPVLDDMERVLVAARKELANQKRELVGSRNDI